MSDQRPIIEIDKVTKRFGSFIAVDDVSLSIPKNALFALLGPSGCGKTTLLRMIGGFELPSEGRIVIDGEEMARVPPNRRPVNMVFQSYAVFPHMTVFDNVAYGLSVTGTPKDEIDNRVAEALGMVRLEAQAQRKPDQLSGGQRQRVALARALIKRPKVLLLDEPLSALDKKLREEMQLELVRLQHEVGITFIIVTHDQEEALGMATHIAVMNEGQLLQVAPPRELYEHPKRRFVAEFIGASNSWPCEVDGIEGNQVTVTSPELGTITVERADESVGEGMLVIRPEKVRLGLNGGEPNEDEILLDAKIEQSSYFGDLSFVYLRTETGHLIQCSRYNVHRKGADDLTPGTACRIAIDPEDLLLVGD